MKEQFDRWVRTASLDPRKMADSSSAAIADCIKEVIVFSFLCVSFLSSDIVDAQPQIIQFPRGVTVNVIAPGENGCASFEELQALRRPNFDHITGHGIAGRMWVGGSLGTIDLNCLEDYGIQKYDRPIREGGRGQRLIFLDSCQGGKLNLNTRNGTSGVWANADEIAHHYNRPVLAATGNIYPGNNYDIIWDGSTTGQGIYQIHFPDGRRIPVAQERVLKMLRYADAFPNGYEGSGALHTRSGLSSPRLFRRADALGLLVGGLEFSGAVARGEGADHLQSQLAVALPTASLAACSSKARWVVGVGAKWAEPVSWGINGAWELGHLVLDEDGGHRYRQEKFISQLPYDISGSLTFGGYIQAIGNSMGDPVGFLRGLGELGYYGAVFAAENGRCSDIHARGVVIERERQRLRDGTCAVPFSGLGKFP